MICEKDESSEGICYCHQCLVSVPTKFYRKTFSSFADHAMCMLLIDFVRNNIEKVIILFFSRLCLVSAHAFQVEARELKICCAWPTDVSAT